MINCFKPFVRTYGRSAGGHEWLFIGFHCCNEVSFTLMIRGYGFSIGWLHFDIVKYLKIKGD